MTMGEALARYCDALRPGATVKAMPYWLLTLVSLLGGKTELKQVIPLMRYFEVVPEAGDPEPANRQLGAPTTTLSAWLSLRRNLSDNDAPAQGRPTRSSP